MEKNRFGIILAGLLCLSFCLACVNKINLTAGNASAGAVDEANPIKIGFINDPAKPGPSFNFPEAGKTWNYDCWDENRLRRANELARLIEKKLEKFGVLEIPTLARFGLRWCAGDAAGRRIIGVFFLFHREGRDGPAYYFDGPFYIWFYFDRLENEDAREEVIRDCAIVIYGYFLGKNEEITKRP